MSLGNVISSSYASKTNPFISAADNELFIKFKVPSFEVQVGLHELLGPGSGKLFSKDAKCVPNFCWYEAGETYDSQFISIGIGI